jgi:hypothetical protein
VIKNDAIFSTNEHKYSLKKTEGKDSDGKVFTTFPHIALFQMSKDGSTSRSCSGPSPNFLAKASILVVK